MLKIAKILTSHGLDGVVKLQSFCEKPNDVFVYSLYDSNKKQMLCKKVGLTSRKDVFLVKFDNINSIDEAKNYRNFMLFAKKDDLDNNSSDDGISTIYLDDLIGTTVLSEGKIGKIIGFSNYGAGDIVDIKWNNSRNESILFSKNLIKSFDRNKNTITIETPEYI